MLISRHGQRADRSAVERVIHCDDLMTAMSVSGIRIFFRRLDCSLDRFRAAIRKEHAVHTARLLQCPGCGRYRHVVVQV